VRFLQIVSVYAASGVVGEIDRSCGHAGRIRSGGVVLAFLQAHDRKLK